MFFWSGLEVWVLDKQVGICIFLCAVDIPTDQYHSAVVAIPPATPLPLLRSDKVQDCLSGFDERAPNGQFYQPGRLKDGLYESATWLPEVVGRECRDSPCTIQFYREFYQRGTENLRLGRSRLFWVACLIGLLLGCILM